MPKTIEEMKKDAIKNIKDAERFLEAIGEKRPPKPRRRRKSKK